MTLPPDQSSAWNSEPAPPGQYQQQPPVPQYAPAAYPPPVAARSSLYVAAAVINWVVLGIVVVSTMGIGVIAAAWMVPMTVLTHKAAKDGYKHTGLAVCTLLFCGLVSGILMLVDEGNRYEKPRW